MTAARKTNVRRSLPQLKTALLPIYVLALVNAIVCWTVCWLFWDRYEFSAALFALGCMPIALAVALYVFLFVKRVERK